MFWFFLAQAWGHCCSKEVTPPLKLFRRVFFLCVSSCFSHTSLRERREKQVSYSSIQRHQGVKKAVVFICSIVFMAGDLSRCCACILLFFFLEACLLLTQRPDFRPAAFPPPPYKAATGVRLTISLLHSRRESHRRRPSTAVVGESLCMLRLFLSVVLRPVATIQKGHTPISRPPTQLLRKGPGLAKGEPVRAKRLAFFFSPPVRRLRRHTQRQRSPPCTTTPRDVVPLPRASTRGA